MNDSRRGDHIMNDPMEQLSWDDLRIIGAVGKSKALAPAAEMLRLNISTIARRLAKVESVLGTALFDRRRSGYLPTPHGEEVMKLADRMELEVISMVHRVSGTGRGHAGKLRITTSDSILLHFLAPIIADFQSANSAMKIEVLVGNNALNLARGESDIAIRATEKPPENLFGRKVATISWAPYAKLSNAELNDGRPFFDRSWVSYAGQLSDLKAFKFLGEQAPPDNIAFRTDSVASAAAAIGAGLGAGYLPCMLGDISRGLVRIGPVEPRLDDELWLLTHPDIRKSGRIYAFMTHCIEAIGQHRGLIEGFEGREPTMNDSSGNPSFA